MHDSSIEDPLTQLNTQLNKSMVLMDTIKEEVPESRNNKSIKINTKVQSASTPNSLATKSRKSILKKPDRKISQENNNTSMEGTNENETTSAKSNTPNEFSTARPHNLDELIQGETLVIDSVESAFNLDDISDSEDVWIMDVPKTIDPQGLAGQQLVLGGKSKFKIKGERYYAVNHNVRCSFTCVSKTAKSKSPYKAVNIKPVGTISIRKKLASTPKIEPMHVESTSVPFPKNLKIRHPLFGVNHEVN